MSNFNFNKVILGGRLCSDAELKSTANGGYVCGFRIAVARKSKEPATDFLNCTAFGKTAEFISTYFHKGSSICVDGSVRCDTYDKDGQKKYNNYIAVNAAYFVDGKSDQPQEEQPQQATYNPYPKQRDKQETPKFEVLEDDEVLPF